MKAGNTVKFSLYTECSYFNQSPEMSQPFEMNKIGEGVLEACFHLLPPHDNTTRATVVFIKNQEDGHTMARLLINHIPGRQDQVNLKCIDRSSNGLPSTTTIPGPDIITNQALQGFFQLRVHCTGVYYDTFRKYSYPLSFSRRGIKQLDHIQRQVSVLSLNHHIMLDE